MMLISSTTSSNAIATAVYPAEAIEAHRACARAFESPYVHEHACVRCSLLRPDPAQQSRLEEIRDNLEARIIEAKREGWLGEVEGLQVSLAGAKDKLAQIDAALQRPTGAVALDMPAFTSLAGRTTSTSPQG
ncbi:hypothetical protein [Lentzea guizhouensis]|uniref:hypothetical protein n=1 Tax=Lentzea guizhouensis TaxID=1586287 RepID=UPI001C54CCEA|nr:hypothetical protein [Lentzea guizhouensis]